MTWYCATRPQWVNSAILKSAVDFDWDNFSNIFVFVVRILAPTSKKLSTMSHTYILIAVYITALAIPDGKYEEISNCSQKTFHSPIDGSSKNVLLCCCHDKSNIVLLRTAIYPANYTIRINYTAWSIMMTKFRIHKKSGETSVSGLNLTKAVNSLCSFLVIFLCKSISLPSTFSWQKSH